MANLIYFSPQAIWNSNWESWYFLILILLSEICRCLSENCIREPTVPSQAQVSMPTVPVTGPAVTQNSPFFTSCSCNHRYNTRFHLPTEGLPDWVDLGNWLHTEMVYPPSGRPESNSQDVDHKSDALTITLPSSLFSHEIQWYTQQCYTTSLQYWQHCAHLTE